MAAELTPREAEIITLKCNGLSSKEISFRLGISTWTVENHVKNIMQKTRARSLLHAVAILHGCNQVAENS